MVVFDRCWRKSPALSWQEGRASIIGNSTTTSERDEVYSVSCLEPENERSHILTPPENKFSVSQIINRLLPGGSGDFLVIRAGAYDVGPRAS